MATRRKKLELVEGKTSYTTDATFSAEAFAKVKLLTQVSNMNIRQLLEYLVLKADPEKMPKARKITIYE